MSRTPEVSPAWLRLVFVVGIFLLPLFSRAQSSSERGQPSKFAKDFPHLDLYDLDGHAGADTITISFLVSGANGEGKTKHFARQIVIQGEELQMPPQDARPKRRSVR